MEINILGTQYKLILDEPSDQEKYYDCDGLCNVGDCIISISDLSRNGHKTAESLKKFKNHLIRHEIIHAFLYESGLGAQCDWAESEEMVDFFALQFPKLLKMFQEVGCI